MWTFDAWRNSQQQSDKLGFKQVTETVLVKENKMRRTLLVMWVSVCFAGGAIAEDDGWISLFNGKNLDGWTSNGGSAKFTVEEGNIVGSTVEGSANTFLCKGPYTNFIFECEVKCDTELNSGIQIRSHVWKEDIKKYIKRGKSNIGVVCGYQCEISPDSPHRCGHVWDEHRQRKWLDEFVDDKATANPYKVGEWNTYRIKAQGHHIQTWINGEAVADFEDDMDSTGFIGLQVHSIKKETGPFQVRWRDIRIQQLK